MGILKESADMKSQLTVVGLGGSLAEHPSSVAALKNRITRRADGGAKTDLLNIRQLSLPMRHPGDCCRSAERLSAGWQSRPR